MAGNELKINLGLLDGELTHKVTTLCTVAGRTGSRPWKRGVVSATGCAFYTGLLSTTFRAGSRATGPIAILSSWSLAEPALHCILSCGKGCESEHD